MPDERQEDYSEPEYLWYYLLKRLSREQERDVSKTQFWKLISITNHYIENELEEDIHFPRYWYQFGEIPEFSNLKLDFQRTNQSVDKKPQTLEIVRELSNNVFSVSQPTREKIKRAIQWAVVNFAGESARTLKDYHYEHQAPKEFILAFDDFREMLRVADPSQSTFDRYFNSGGRAAEDDLKEKLKKILITYPEEDYDLMYETFLTWENTTSLLIRQGEYRTAEKLMDDFYKALSKVEFRIHHNENVPESKLSKWRHSRKRIRNGFERNLFDVREDALREYTDLDELEFIAEPYSEAMRQSF